MKPLTVVKKELGAQKKKRRAHRPCRGKRLRYQKLVRQICAQVETDPASFNFSGVDLPPSLTANPRKCQLFEAQVSWYQQQLLSGGTLVNVPSNVGRLTQVPWYIEQLLSS